MRQNKETLKDIQDIMQRFFKDPGLIILENTTAHDIDAWDSLNHMGLINEIEKKFKLKFDFFEIMDLENIGDLIQCIQNKM